METENTCEIWRDIPGYEGWTVSNKNGLRHNGEDRKGYWCRKYRRATINHQVYMYHILVAKAFPEICGEWFEGCNVHHKDFNPTNNTPENLVVLTANEHHKLHYKHQPDSFKKPSKKRSESISKALSGKRAVHKHIPILQLTLDGEVVKEWECISDVVTLGYDVSNVCHCCRNKLKTAYGYKWCYK